MEFPHANRLSFSMARQVLQSAHGFRVELGAVTVAVRPGAEEASQWPTTDVPGLTEADHGSGLQLFRLTAVGREARCGCPYSSRSGAGRKRMEVTSASRSALIRLIEKSCGSRCHSY